MEVAIIGGLGVAGIVTCVVAGYLFHNRLATEAEDARDKEAAAEESLKHETAKTALLEKNAAALESQISSLKTSNTQLTAQLAAAEKVADDLAATVKNYAPSALPDALRATLDRLRAHVKVPDVSTAPAAGDPGGGKAGAVHEATKEGTAGRP